MEAKAEPQSQSPCYICFTMFPPDELGKHKEMHLQQAIQNCKRCIRGFKMSARLSKHLAEHAHYMVSILEQKQLSSSTANCRCIICGLCFSYEGALRKHICTKHKNSEQLPAYIDYNAANAKNSHEGHICGICKAQLKTTSIDDMIRHIASHKSSGYNVVWEYTPGEEISFSCKPCGAKYKYFGSFLTHLKFHEDHTCLKCGSVYGGEKALQMHKCRKDKDGKTKFSEQLNFNICKTKIRGEAVTQHRQTCGICGKVIEGTVEMGEHMKLHQSVMVSQPIVSSSSTSSDNNLPLQCTTCGRRFKFHGSLMSHLKLHEKEIQRAQSNIISTQNDVKTNRLLYKEGTPVRMALNLQPGLKPYRPVIRAPSPKARPPVPQKRTYPCVICNKTYQSEYRFVKHFECTVHSVYPCPFCGTLEQDADDLAFHLRTHDLKPVELVQVEKPIQLNVGDFLYIHECKYCNSLFKFEGSLNIHLKICKNRFIGMSATEKKNAQHTCKVCNAVFHDQKGLKMHLGKHTQKAPVLKVKAPVAVEGRFQCRYCADYFGCEKSLKTHIWEKHTVHCPECTKVFSNDTALAFHINDEHGNYRCEPCNRTFNTRIGYTLHQSKQHAIQVLMDPPVVGVSNTIGQGAQHTGKEFSPQIVPPKSPTPAMSTGKGKTLTYKKSQDNNNRKVSPKSKAIKKPAKKIKQKADPVYCQICGREFLYAGALSRHMSTHYKMRCSDCGFQSGSEKAFEAHECTGGTE